MIGYLAFALLLFFPGFFFELTTGFYRGKRALEVLAAGIGISLILVPLALTVAVFARLAISPALVYALLVISLVGTVAAMALRRIPVRLPKTNGFEKAVIGLVFIQGLLLLAHFNKYPIFPISYSEDFRIHLQTALAFQAGSRSLASISYPPAVHLWIAVLLSLESGISVALMQHAIAIVATVAPLLIYVVLGRMFKDQRLALAGAAIWIISGAIWDGGLLISGLYANFLADLDTLTILYLVVDGLDEFGWSRKLLFLACSGGLYLSHFTIVILVAAVWIGAPIVWRLRKASLINYLQMAGIVSLPAGLIALVRPDSITLLLSFTGLRGSAAGLFPAGSITAPFGSISPFLQNLYLEIGPAFMALTLLTIPVILYSIAKKRDAWALFALVWFVVVWAVTPYSDIAWRYSYYSLIPLMILWPMALDVGLSPVISRLPRKRIAEKKRSRVTSKVEHDRVAVGFVVLIVSGILFYNAPLYANLGNLTLSPSQIAQNQVEIYQVINYFGTHSNGSVKVLGLEDWRFRFLDPMYGDNITVYTGANAQAAYNFALAQGYKYLVVSQFLVPGPFSAITGTTQNYGVYDTFPGLKLLYSDPSAKVFLVTGT